tara:strand:+ start:224 stop:478 length:255 start_codon:yes stop_codon:yes gene_type:complete
MLSHERRLKIYEKLSGEVRYFEPDKIEEIITQIVELEDVIESLENQIGDNAKLIHNLSFTGSNKTDTDFDEEIGSSHLIGSLRV